MILLAIDTAAALCAACILDTEADERGRAVRDLGKGHAEHLMAVVAEALGEAGATYADLDAIAVSVGPGSFTGVRVGVAAARGLALALNIPAVGVSTLEAIAAEAQTAGTPVTVALDAGRGQVYLQDYGPAGAPASQPTVMSIEAARAHVAHGGETVLAGSGARHLAPEGAADRIVLPDAATADIATYACIAARRLSDETPGSIEKPKPLYLRDADAKPQGAFALPRENAP